MYHLNGPLQIHCNFHILFSGLCYNVQCAHKFRYVMHSNRTTETDLRRRKGHWQHTHKKLNPQAILSLQRPISPFLLSSKRAHIAFDSNAILYQTRISFYSFCTPLYKYRNMQLTTARRQFEASDNQVNHYQRTVYVSWPLCAKSNRNKNMHIQSIDRKTSLGRRMDNNRNRPQRPFRRTIYFFSNAKGS